MSKMAAIAARRALRAVSQLSAACSTRGCAQVSLIREQAKFGKPRLLGASFTASSAVLSCAPRFFSSSVLAGASSSSSSSVGGGSVSNDRKRFAGSNVPSSSSHPAFPATASGLKTPLPSSLKRRRSAGGGGGGGTDTTKDERWSGGAQGRCIAYCTLPPKTIPIVCIKRRSCAGTAPLRHTISTRSKRCCCSTTGWPSATGTTCCTSRCRSVWQRLKPTPSSLRTVRANT